MKFLQNYIATIFVLLIIISCGGGGGSSSSETIPVGPSNPSITNFVSDKESIFTNESVTLTWSTQNATSCDRSGDWDGVTSTNGSSSIVLNQVKTYTFTLTCSGASGTQNATASISVNVLQSTSNEVGFEIYNEDKDSYCKNPQNDSSSYWIDNFDSNILDPNIYTYQTGNGFFAGDSYIAGWGNNEVQYYTSDQPNSAKSFNPATNTTENLFIKDSKLIIQPIYDINDKFEDPYCIGRDCNYTWDHTSARIITSASSDGNGSKGKTIGINTEVTACFKVPAGTGFWPAIWLLPQGFIEGTKSWPRDGEIDIMEARGRVPGRVGSAVHWGPPRELYSEEIQVPLSVNFQDKFHSLTLVRTQNSIKVYIDTITEPFYEFTSSNNRIMNDYWPFNEDFYLLFNVAVGGDYDSGRLDNNVLCANAECTNLSDPSKGQLQIEYIEVKSID